MFLPGVGVKEGNTSIKELECYYRGSRVLRQSGQALATSQRARLPSADCLTFVFYGVTNRRWDVVLYLPPTEFRRTRTISPSIRIPSLTGSICERSSWAHS